jgi:hypothetical protein
MAEQFGKFVKGISIGQEGDGIDKTHFGQVPLVSMGTFAFVLLLKYTGMRAMVCWVPYVQGVAEEWVEYSTYYCYVTNTFLPNSNQVFGDTALDEIRAGDIHQLEYYQWVPFIFMFVAVLFYLPNLLWSGILESQGVNITAMVKSVNGFESAMDMQKREKSISQLARYMMVHFTSKKTIPKHVNPIKKVINKITCQNDSSYVGRLYLLLKLIELGNAVGILFILNLWLDGWTFYGFNVIASLFNGNYNDVNHFPTLAFCNLTKREIAADNDHSFLCVMNMNLFYEKMFTLYWFYLFFVAVKTVINALLWFKKIIFTGSHMGYIATILRLSKSAQTDSDPEFYKKPDFKEFVTKFLKPDGVFIFQMINCNTSTVVMHEVMGKLYELYKEQKDQDRIGKELEEKRKNMNAESNV